MQVWVFCARGFFSFQKHFTFTVGRTADTWVKTFTTSSFRRKSAQWRWNALPPLQTRTFCIMHERLFYCMTKYVQIKHDKQTRMNTKRAKSEESVQKQVETCRRNILSSVCEPYIYQVLVLLSNQHSEALMYITQLDARGFFVMYEKRSMKWNASVTVKTGAWCFSKPVILKSTKVSWLAGCLQLSSC